MCSEKKVGTDEEVRIKELKSQTRELEQEKKALLIQAAAAEKEEKLSAEIAALEEQLLLTGNGSRRLRSF